MMICRTTRIGEFAAAYRIYYRRYCTTQENQYTNEYTQKKTIHPYLRIHPWKSETEFADSLLKNIIYNADGIIAINKPYGISVRNKFQNLNHPLKQSHHVAGAVDYSIENVLPYLAKKLDAPNLIPFSGSEKYMSGVYIFGINSDVCENMRKAIRQVKMGKYRKFWAITTRVPNEIKGKYHLAISLQEKSFSSKNKKPVILTQWSNNSLKNNIVKIFNIDYRIISNSTNNLSSLIEMEASTKKWHSLRLFASTMLYSPILGDNYHGSRVQEIMGTWIRIDPFAESCLDMPKINKQLLELLNVRQSQQEIIPAHIHLRNVRLISFGKERKDIILEAPLIHPFDWTCKQLKFKNVPYEENNRENEKEKIMMKV